MSVPTTQPSFAGPVTVIRPSSGWAPIRFRELWQYRETLYFLVWRDIKVRYKQTAIGVSWAIIQPVMIMVVFSVVFGRLARMPSDGIPYPVFAFCGLVPWMFFANGLQQSAHSLVSSTQLITKVYFPRLLIPAARILAGLPDFLMAFVVLLGILWHYDIGHGFSRMVWLPLFALLAFATALGIGLWFSALNVKYRDVQHAVPFIVQVWLFSTPIAYPASLMPEVWRPVYALNPMVGVVEGFRWALIGLGRPPDVMMLIASSLAAFTILVSGAFYFKRVERHFADII
jgi:lipopolysaccharide transport system permease protein